MAVEAPVRLSKQQVLSMSKELLDGFSTPDFQQKLQALLHGNHSAYHVPGRNELALTVQSRVLPKYGIPGTPEGVLQMLAAVSQFRDDWLLQQMEWVIYEKLGINDEPSIDKLMGEVRSNPTKKKKRSVTLAWSEVSNESRPVDRGRRRAMTNPELHNRFAKANPEVHERLSSAQILSMTEDIEQGHRRSMTNPEIRNQSANSTPEAHDSLNRNRILSMTKEVLWEICAPDFQEKLLNLHDVPSRIKLALVASSKVLPKYGIPCTLQGSGIMLEAISPFLDDWMLQDILQRIDFKLGMHTEHFVDELRSFLDSSHKQALTVPVRLTEKEVLSMVKELVEGFSTSEFQLNLQALQRNSKIANQAPVRSTPALTVQSTVLQKHGIPGSLKGIEIMLEAIIPFMDDWRLNQMLCKINNKFRAVLETPDSQLIVPSHQPTVEDNRSLTKHQVLSMAEELLDGFCNPDFQLKLYELLCASTAEDTVESKNGWLYNQGFVHGRRELALTVQSEVLPKYGIPGTAEGVQIMRTIIAKFKDDDKLRKIQVDIEDALGMKAWKPAEISKVHTVDKPSESTVTVFPGNPPMPKLLGQVVLQNKESVVRDKLGMSGEPNNQSVVHEKLGTGGEPDKQLVVYDKLGMGGEVEKKESVVYDL